MLKILGDQIKKWKIHSRHSCMDKIWKIILPELFHSNVFQTCSMLATLRYIVSILRIFSQSWFQATDDSFFITKPYTEKKLPVASVAYDVMSDYLYCLPLERHIVIPDNISSVRLPKRVPSHQSNERYVSRYERIKERLQSHKYF